MSTRRIRQMKSVFLSCQALKWKTGMTNNKTTRNDIQTVAHWLRHKPFLIALLMWGEHLDKSNYSLVMHIIPLPFTCNADPEVAKKK